MPKMVEFQSSQDMQDKVNFNPPPKTGKVGDVVYFNSKGEFVGKKRGKYRALLVAEDLGVYMHTKKNGKRYKARIEREYCDVAKKKFKNEKVWFEEVREFSIAMDYTSIDTPRLHRLESMWKAGCAFSEDIEINVDGLKPVNELKGKEKRKTAIILATGPSLNDNAHLLDCIDPEKAFVISLNSAHMKTGVDVIDYHFGSDHRMKPEWGDNMQDVIGVFSPKANKEMVNKDYKEKHFFGVPSRTAGWKRVRDTYIERYPDVVEFDQAVNVGGTAMHFAYWLGAENIIWLGLDSCWSEEGVTHWQKDVNKTDSKDVDYQEDVFDIDMENGDVWKTKNEYKTHYDIICGHSYWLHKAGARVFNCTEGGVFWLNPNSFHPELVETRESIHGNECQITSFPSYYFSEVINALELGV